jgi:hypothetical protein
MKSMDESKDTRSSTRFQPTKWSEWLVPALLIMLVIGLFVTLGIVLLSVFQLI